MNVMFFLFIVVLPDLVEVLTDTEADGLGDLFFFEYFVEGRPAFVVLDGGFLDVSDDAPDGVDEECKDKSHEYNNKAAVSNSNRIPGGPNAIANGSSDLRSPVGSIQQPVGPGNILNKINPAKGISEPELIVLIVVALLSVVIVINRKVNSRDPDDNEQQYQSYSEKYVHQVSYFVQFQVVYQGPVDFVQGVYFEVEHDFQVDQ